jgi:hypothetical protein
MTRWLAYEKTRGSPRIVHSFSSEASVDRWLDESHDGVRGTIAYSSLNKHEKRLINNQLTLELPHVVPGS